VSKLQVIVHSQFTMGAKSHQNLNLSRLPGEDAVRYPSAGKPRRNSFKTLSKEGREFELRRERVAVNSIAWEKKHGKNWRP